MSYIVYGHTNEITNPSAHLHSFYNPVSSICIWSENLVAESEAKDGGS